MIECESREQDRLAISVGMGKAAELLVEFGYHEALMPTQRVDVFDCIDQAGAKLGFESLDARLLGGFVKLHGFVGIILNTKNSLCIQRFVAAHELGHFVLGHPTHFDYENILLRGPIVDGRVSRNVASEEREADAFASRFLLPSRLINTHMDLQGWEPRDLMQPEILYQASLRFGSSYAGAVYGLERENLIDSSMRRELLNFDSENLKRSLLDDQPLPDLERSDVWLLTDNDEGSVIEAGRDDLFLLKLKEDTGAGYVWSFDEMGKAGFAILKDGREPLPNDPLPNEGVGSPNIRSVLARAQNPTIESRTLTLTECRPWNPEDDPQHFNIHYRFVTSDESGLFSRQQGQLAAP